MPGIRPELIFVEGPQAGHRVVIMDNAVIAGRGTGCEIVISEHAVSRQQMSFTLTHDGWVVENVSKTSRIEVDGKKYKIGKKIILETGDIIKVGLETVVLYVAPGDDPDAALNAAGLVIPVTSPTQQPVMSEPVNAPASPEPVAQEPPAKPAEKKTDTKKVELPPEKKTANDKMKKYLIFGGIYIVAMIGLFVFLSMVKGSASRGSSKQPPHMTHEQVTKALTCELDYSPSPESSARSLRLARKYYAARANAEKNLYLSVKNYRLYLAYRPKNRRTFEPADERQYRIARSELVDKIMAIYDNAWALENGSHWAAALNEYEAIWKYIPPGEISEFYSKKEKYTDKKFIRNIKRHTIYVSKQLKRKK